MKKEISFAIDRYVDTRKDEIIEDLDRLVRIPSVSKPDSPEPLPFGADCARVLEEAVKMAEEKGMKACNYGNWYGLATRGEGTHTVGIFSHLDVVEVGNDWTFPPFEVTEKDGWLFGRGVADDKIAAVIGFHTAKALDELDLAKNTKLLLYLGVCEEKGMADIDRYLQEHEQPEFNLVLDFMFPGSIGESGVMKFKLNALQSFTQLSHFKGGEPGKRMPLEASADYTGSAGEQLVTLAGNAAQVEVSLTESGAHMTAKGKAASSRTAHDSINAIAVLADFLSGSGVLNENDRLLVQALADMAGSAHGECFGIDCDSQRFGKTNATCLMAEEADGKLMLSYDIRYPMEITGAEIQEKVRAYGAETGFVMTRVNDTAAWLLSEEDPRIQLLCDCWEDVSGVKQTMRVGGGTYARKLKNAVSYGPKDPCSRCPFLPEGHGEIHSPDECRSVEAVLNAVKVYIRAIVELDAYYAAQSTTEDP